MPTMTRALDLPRRPRRLRRSAGMRGLVRETRLSAESFVYPLFVANGERARREVPLDARRLQPVCGRDRQGSRGRESGWRARGPALRHSRHERRDGQRRDDPEGPVQCAVRAIKREVPGMIVMTDVCLCEYTSHGHCGVIVNDDVDNDVTVDLLVRAALSHAAAGADVVAPSDMMDGRVGAIRRALDENGFTTSRSWRTPRSTARPSTVPFREAAGLDAGVRRPPVAPDGSGQRRGSAARGGAGPRRRRRHRHGEAGDAVPGCDLAGEVHASRSPPRRTTSAANTRCSRPRHATAGSTSPAR